jgi:hypothetical protein
MSLEMVESPTLGEITASIMWITASNVVMSAFIIFAFSTAMPPI